MSKKRDRKKERELLLLKEVGGGISDLCQGAVNKYAPKLRWESGEREALITERRAEGSGFFPHYQLAETPSEPCLDALAVWRPFALRHLLSLDPTPQLKLVDARRAVARTRERYERYQTMMDRLEGIRPVLAAVSADDRVRSLSMTYAALRDVIRAGSAGVMTPENSLSREDAMSDKAPTLERMDHVLFYLLADIRTLRDQAASSLQRAQTDLASVTGAREWNADQSRRVSRRLSTLVDSLRCAYLDGRWSWSRIASLIQLAQTDWTTPPCPLFGAKDPDDIVATLKMRDRREKERRSELKLTEREIYPWLRRS
jgi:hypothetical protein